MDDDPWDDWEAAADAGVWSTFIILIQFLVISTLLDFDDFFISRCQFDPKPSKAVDEHEKNKQLWQEAYEYLLCLFLIKYSIL